MKATKEFRSYFVPMWDIPKIEKALAALKLKPAMNDCIEALRDEIECVKAAALRGDTQRALDGGIEIGMRWLAIIDPLGSKSPGAPTKGYWDIARDLYSKDPFEQRNVICRKAIELFEKREGNIPKKRRESILDSMEKNFNARISQRLKK